MNSLRIDFASIDRKYLVWKNIDGNSKLTRIDTPRFSHYLGEMTRYISYIRVSTEKQGRSGLGLEAQRERITAFLRAHGGDVLAEYCDVESGAVDDRPQLDAAILHARKEKATILVAKLDRLSRDVHFITGLQKRGVDFVVAEFGPEIPTMMLQFLAVIAEEERRMISARTKAALAAKKARGEKVGSPNFDEIRKLGPKALKTKALKRTKPLRILAADLRAAGMTIDGIAREMERRGVLTSRGNTTWSSTQVARLLANGN